MMPKPPFCTPSHQDHIQSFPQIKAQPQQRTGQLVHMKGVSPPHQDIDTDTSLDLEVQIPLGTAFQSLHTSSPHTRPARSHTDVRGQTGPHPFHPK
jgi:hypothetical protein